MMIRSLGLDRQCPKLFSSAARKEGEHVCPGSGACGHASVASWSLGVEAMPACAQPHPHRSIRSGTGKRSSRTLQRLAFGQVKGDAGEHTGWWWWSGGDDASPNCLRVVSLFL